MTDIMKHTARHCLALILLLPLWAGPASAQAPQRDLVVELRQIEEGDAAGYTVRTQPAKGLLQPQQVRVRNGSKASLRLSQSIPVTWVQSIKAPRGSGGAAVARGLTWLDSGQQLAVQPRWPGGKQDVTVEIEVQAAAVEPRSGAELPDQTRSQLATTLSAPLGQWVTIASSGARAQRGSYSSEAAEEHPSLIQIRVTAP